MTKTIWVPVHLDALVLDRPEPVVGPGLDLANAPWFGESGDGGPRDHFANVANVASAMRSDPMSPDNRLLQPGTHLHWALPDALTHGTTQDPKSSTYVNRDSLWFPKVPNRWVILRHSGPSLTNLDTLDNAWMVESDFVHPLPSNASGAVVRETAESVSDDMHATLYAIPPGSARKQPFVRLGRSYSLLGSAPSAKSDGALSDYDADLTAVGHGDPSFAALYTACHSVFGLYDAAPITRATRYSLLGWYADPKDNPLSHWRGLASSGTNRQLYEVFQSLTGWALEDVDAQIKALDETADLPGSTSLFDQSCQLGFAASVELAKTLKQAPKPKAVTGATAVGISTTEALSALLSEGDANLEHMLEALGFHTDLKDHALDHDAKLREARHSAGFTTTGKKTVWALRPPETSVSDPLTGQIVRNEPSMAALPSWIALELNQLNVAQDALSHAVDTAQELRAQMYADWQLYMRATYPEDDRADFALDVDLLRDEVLVKSIARFEEALSELHPDNQGSKAANLAAEMARMKGLLESLEKRDSDIGALELVPLAGPRFNVPNDPVIATAGEAFEPSRRHGNDGRARNDGKLECMVADAPKFPQGTMSQADAEAYLTPVLGAKNTAFDAIARHKPQTLRSWNPIMLEWQAAVRAYKPSTNMRAQVGRYDKDALTNPKNFELGFEDCELKLRSAPADDDLAGATYVSGRTILNMHGPQLLSEAIEQAEAAEKAKPTLSQSEATDLATLKKRVGDAMAAKSGAHTISTSLGGFNERLLMRVMEEQLPIADPLGFPEDQARAENVQAHVGNPNGFWSAETEAPFLPLRTAKMNLQEGRIIDSFGQHVPWLPGGKSGNAILPAESMRGGSALDVYLPPRSAQPSRVDFRWLDAQNDLMQSNDHPASSPLCGWIVPNDLDKDVLVYGADGALLGIIDFTGIWRPAPGDPDAPAGPGLIPNKHLARVASWIVEHGSDAFISNFLDTLDSALTSIDPVDYSVQDAAALLVGRPIAVARAMVDLSLQGPPAQDQSQQAIAARIEGLGTMDHGFGDVQIPMRLGEHGQLNDGLVGYFRDDENAFDRHTKLYVPQSDPAKAPIQNSTSRDLSHSFNDEAKILTLLLDPRCPVHLTTGLLPTKSIRIPQDQFMPSMRSIEAIFAAMPVLTPPEAIHLPLPRLSGQSWSWVALEDGHWSTVSGRATASLEDLRKAFPGRYEITSPTSVSLLTSGEGSKTGKPVRPAADLMWEELLIHEWVTEIEPGKAWLKGPPSADSPPLGYGFGTMATQSLLSKIAKGIQPTSHTAQFGPRPVAREGWLKLTPQADKI
ncbi:MAG: hypothetical protein AAGD04_14810 [Pseudomonadota bacterium]